MVDFSTLPTSWDDNLDWSANAVPTLRHIQAIIQALSERITLSHNVSALAFSTPFKAATITDNKFLNDCIPLKAEVIERISYMFYNEFERLKRIGPSYYSIPCGSLGDGYVSFHCNDNFFYRGDNAYPYYSKAYWLDMNESYYELSTGRFDQAVRNLGNNLLNSFNCFCDIHQGDEFMLSKRKLMNFLIRCKSFLASLNTFSCYDFCFLNSKNGGFKTTVYDYTGYEDFNIIELPPKASNISLSQKSFDSNGKLSSENTYTPIIKATSQSTRTDSDSDPDYRNNYYSFICQAPPLKYKHLCKIPATLSVHCYQKLIVNGVIQDKFLNLGTPLYYKGWNEIATLNYNDEVDILPAASFSPSQNNAIIPDIWHAGQNRDFSGSFEFGIDGFRLDFYQSNGFNF